MDFEIMQMIVFSTENFNTTTQTRIQQNIQFSLVSSDFKAVNLIHI